MHVICSSKEWGWNKIKGSLQQYFKIQPSRAIYVCKEAVLTENMPTENLICDLIGIRNDQACWILSRAQHIYRIFYFGMSIVLFLSITKIAQNRVCYSQNLQHKVRIRLRFKRLWWQNRFNKPALYRAKDRETSNFKLPAERPEVPATARLQIYRLAGTSEQSLCNVYRCDRLSFFRLWLQLL